MKIEKFAFYDFDDTLLKHDSMGHLYLYYLKKHPLKIYRCIVLGYKVILYVLKIISFIQLKEELIYPISQMTDEELSSFYKEDLIPRYYPHVIDTIHQHIQDGFQVWLISASPEPYLICTDLPFGKIIGTKVDRIGNRWTNRIISKNCKNEEKVNRINEALDKMNLCIDYENSYAYSDSISDLPMFKLVKNRVLINKKNGEMSPFN